MADASGAAAWGRDSIVQSYSVTKPFVAVCALRLVERGELELDAAVQRYWPEFTARATVRQLLAHQAGVVALDTPAATKLFYDWDGMCARLAGQSPAWEPGTTHGESALFYGHLVGELVRSIDGRSVGAFLREEICGPLGLDFAIRLSELDQTRAVELTGLNEAFRAPVAGAPELYQRAISNPPGARDGAVVNSACWRAAEIPAVNGHGTARGIAGFYAALLKGSALGPTLLAEATTVQASGNRPGLRRAQRIRPRLRARRGRVRHGRRWRQLRRCEPGRLRHRVRHGLHGQPRPRSQVGERPANLPRPGSNGWLNRDSHRRLQARWARSALGHRLLHILSGELSGLAESLPGF